MTDPENPEPPSKLSHCRICHRDTNDRDKHFKLHHEASGGFSNDCAEWNCATYRRTHADHQEHLQKE